MSRKIGQIISRGDGRWLIRVYSDAITKRINATTTTEQSTAPGGVSRTCLKSLIFTSIYMNRLAAVKHQTRRLRTMPEAVSALSARGYGAKSSNES